MTIHPFVQRTAIAAYFCALGAVYMLAWVAPGIGLTYDDAVYLVTAKGIAAGHGYTQTQFPPVFPALLAFFTLVSRQPQWLKLLPLACSAGWLALTRRLLLKMGASRNEALLLAGIAAASPTVVFLSTNLMAESLFALLMTAALLALLEERALAAGLLAGLATLTRIAGVPLIAACILTLVVRRRLRGAAVFAATAMVMVAPWFGWALAHPSNNYRASNILTALDASEKATVLGHNFMALMAGPYSLLGGNASSIAVAVTIVALLWSLLVRRQLVPDLFLALYCLMLLFWIWPPERFVAPVLPLVLWILWRVFRLMARQEALIAMAAVACLFPLVQDSLRLPATLTSGYFPVSGAPADNWTEMEKLFGFIRANTAPDSVLLANLDQTFYLNTGRRAVRGFVPNGFELFYSPRPAVVTPDRLASAIGQAQVGYVALTPDRGLAESAAFHRSVEALEHGGVLEPVSMPGGSRDYRLLKVTR